MSENLDKSNDMGNTSSFTFQVTPSPQALKEAEQLLSAARKNTVSKEAAIKFLVSTGMYSPQGDLIPVEDR